MPSPTFVDSSILEAAEATFDDIAVLIGSFVVTNALLAIGFSGDDRLDAVLLEKGTKRIGVISFVGNKLGDAGNQAHTCFGDNAIGSVAGRQYEHPWTAIRIDNRMNFAVSATFCDAYRLGLGPPFPPLAQRWIFT
jgi:hypothetical protein